MIDCGPKESDRSERASLLPYTNQRGVLSFLMCIKRPRDRTKNCGMDCILAIIRALRTGSCFPLEGASAHPYSPSSKGRKKRRQRRASSSLDSKREEELRKFPGRMYLNGSSEVASLFTRQGKKGANQDAMIVWEVCFFFFNFCSG